MNRKQKIVLWIGIFTIVLMCLFPPWVIVLSVGSDRSWKEIQRYMNNECKITYPFPKKTIIKPYYGFILEPPRLPYRHYGLRPKKTIDFPFCCSVKPRFIASFMKTACSEEAFHQWFGKNWLTENVFIDRYLLTVECAIAALITGGLLCTFTTKEKYKHKEQKVEIRK